MDITITMPEITVKELQLLKNQLSAYNIIEFQEKTHDFQEAKGENEAYVKKKKLLSDIGIMTGISSLVIGLVSMLAMTSHGNSISFGTIFVCLSTGGAGMAVLSIWEEYRPTRANKRKKTYFGFDLEEYYKNALTPDVYSWWLLTKRLEECVNIVYTATALQKWTNEHIQITISNTNKEAPQSLHGINADTLMEEDFDLGVLSAYMKQDGACDLMFVENYVDTIRNWLKEHPVPIEISPNTVKDEDSEQTDTDVASDLETFIRSYITKHESDCRYNTIVEMLVKIRKTTDEISKEQINQNLTIYSDVLTKLLISYESLVNTTVQSEAVETAKAEILETVSQTNDAFLKILTEHKEGQAMEIISEANALQQKYVLDGMGQASGMTLPAQF